MASTSTSSFMVSKTAISKTALFFTSPGIVKRSFVSFIPASPSVKPLRTRSLNATKFDEVTSSLDEDMDQIRRLQNGSDVRGVALEGEKGRTVDLTPAAVEAIAESFGFGEWVAATKSNRKGAIKVSLGRDPRVSGGIKVYNQLFYTASQIWEKPATQTDGQNGFNLLEEIWNIKCSTKLKFLLWKAMKDILPVGENLKARGINTEAMCPHCNQPETSLHLFFHCNQAREIWNLAPFKATINPDNISSFRQALESSHRWITLPPTGIGKEPLLPWILWAIWSNRNKRIFEKKQISAPDLLSQAISQAREWNAAQHTHSDSPETRTKSQINTGSESQTDMIHCFSDAAWKSDTKSAGFRWILIDPLTKSEIQGSYTATNVKSPLLAEAMALCSAQQHAIDLGFKKVFFASDSQMLIKALNSETSSKELHGIQHDILNLSLAFDEFFFSFVSRKNNRRADEIAKSSLLSVLIDSATIPDSPV